MTSSRTRAVLLLAAALLAGGVAGYALKSVTNKDDGRRGGGNGRGWMSELNLTREQVDTINNIWRRNEKFIDSLTESRIGPQKDSLWESIHPAWDSLYGTIRADVDSARARTRQETRAALPDSLRSRYDSVVAAADSSRRKGLEQRNAGGRGGPDRGGPNRGGPAPGRGGGGPPGDGHGSFF